MRLGRVAFLLGAVWLVSSCGNDSAGPAVDPLIPVPVELGDTVTVTADSGTQGRLYVFRSDSAVTFTVFMQSLSDYGAVILKDPATSNWISVATSPPDNNPGHLLFNRTDVISLDPREPILIQVVSGYLPPRRARIRFYVHAVNRTPELVPPALTFGDTLTGETLSNSADIDEFELPVVAGDEIIAFLKTAPGASERLLQVVRIHAPGGTGYLAEIPGIAAGADIEARSTGVVTIPSTGVSRIAVVGAGNAVTSPGEASGTYQLLVRKVNRAPESIGAVIAVNDTAEGERIDHVGDIDEFAVNVTAGEGYRVFLQTVGAAAGALLGVTLPVPDLSVYSATGDTALVGQASNVFVAANTGPVSLRVAGFDPTSGFDRGGYRLFVYHINRPPELVPAMLGVGDSILAETIEYPGDVDSFHVTAGTTGLVNYVLRHPGSPPGPAGALWFSWSAVTPPDASLSCYPGAGPRSCGGGTHAVPGAGEWLKVSADERTRGGYEIRSYEIDSLPEGPPPAIPLGQEVQEAVEPAGDFDVYTVPVGPDQLYDIEVDCGCAWLTFGFSRNGDDLFGISGYGAAWRTGRFAFPDTGTYNMYVAGGSRGGDVAEHGSYRFRLRRLPITLETAGPGLGITDTVTAESIDSLGDVDEFTVTGVAGQELLAGITPTLRLQALLAGTTDTLRTASNGATGIITVPAGGQFRIRVFEARGFESYFTQAFHFTGPYVLSLRPLDREPETLPAAVTRGVEAVGESIDYIGDIDEFTFDGLAGDTVVVRMSNLQSFGTIRLLLDFLGPTGAVLASITDLFRTPTTTPAVTLPLTGTYRIRVRNFEDWNGTGAYQVLVQ